MTILNGKVALISGANQGLGLEIAKTFLQAGAKLSLCARNEALLERAKTSLLRTHPHGEILITATDIRHPSSVSHWINQSISHFGNIHILVANAAIHGPKGPFTDIPFDDWSSAIDINLKGSAAQCYYALPHFLKMGSGKIILLSGGGATKPMPNLSAYAASKAAIVRFGETLAEEIKTHHIDVNMLAPGALNTRLLNDILEAGPMKVGEQAYQRAREQEKQGGDSIQNAAKLALFLASNESDGISGKLISAVWDPWRNLAAYKEALRTSDIYTLRRITPEDRQKHWSEA